MPVKTLSVAPSSTTVVTSVASSTTSQPLLMPNVSRKGAAIFNESTSAMYVKLGLLASATSYTVLMVAGSTTAVSYYEVPYGYTGQIDGIWVAANGAARITEFF